MGADDKRDPPLLLGSPQFDPEDRSAKRVKLEADEKNDESQRDKEGSGSPDGAKKSRNVSSPGNGTNANNNPFEMEENEDTIAGENVEAADSEDLLKLLKPYLSEVLLKELLDSCDSLLDYIEDSGGDPEFVLHSTAATAFRRIFVEKVIRPCRSSSLPSPEREKFIAAVQKTAIMFRDETRVAVLLNVCGPAKWWAEDILQTQKEMEVAQKEKEREIALGVGGNVVMIAGSNNNDANTLGAGGRNPNGSASSSSSSNGAAGAGATAPRAGKKRRRSKEDKKMVKAQERQQRLV